METTTGRRSFENVTAFTFVAEAFWVVVRKANNITRVESKQIKTIHVEHDDDDEKQKG